MQARRAKYDINLLPLRWRWTESATVTVFDIPMEIGGIFGQSLVFDGDGRSRCKLIIQIDFS